MQGFWNEEEAYTAWLAAHPDGYVLNIGSPSKTRSTVHVVNCPHLYEVTLDRKRTDTFGKIVTDSADELATWAKSFGHTLVPCKTCKPLVEQT